MLDDCCQRGRDVEWVALYLLLLVLVLVLVVLVELADMILCPCVSETPSIFIAKDLEESNADAA